MEIKTRRLCLRPVSSADLPSTYAYASDPENTRLMMFLPYASIAEAAAAIRQSEAEWQKDAPDHLEFVILADGCHVGGITLYFTGEGEAELGWIIDQRHWRRGYALEAAQAMIAYARTHWKIRRVFACCDSENLPSYRLMEKLGMHRVSCLPGRKNRSSPEERMELLYEILF